MAMELDAEPEAIFFPKFENATEQARALYAQMAAEAEGRGPKQQQHVLVAAVKSSGSLFLATARAGALVVASKNGMGNVYSDCGHLVLVRHLQHAHGAAWRRAYYDLVRLLERRKLSLGCELVTRALGDHADMPAHDHLVVNAVLDRRTMAAVSPVLLLHICRHFGLVAPGMYLFRGPDATAQFLSSYDKLRFDIGASWDDCDRALSASAWRVVPMPYTHLHSQTLEGYVCCWVPMSQELEEWASLPDAAAQHPSLVHDMASPLPGGCDDAALDVSLLGQVSPLAHRKTSVLPALDGLVNALRVEHADDSARQRLARLQPILRSLLGDLGLIVHSQQEATDSALAETQSAAGQDTERKTLQRKVEAMLASCRPKPVSRDVLGSAASASEPGAGEGGSGNGRIWGARGFLRMLEVLKALHIKYEVKVFPLAVPTEDFVQDGADTEAHVVVHIFNDSSFVKYAKRRASHPEDCLPPLLRGQTWWLHFAPTGPSGERPVKRSRRAAGKETSTEATTGWPRSTDSERGAAGRGLGAGKGCDAGRGRVSGSISPAAEYSAYEPPPALEFLRGQGPREGSIYKFKLLCYTHRTFIFRNLGAALAKGTLDEAAYEGQVGSLLQSDLFRGMHVDTHGFLADRARQWASYILSLPPRERERVSDEFLAYYRRFLAELAARGAVGEGGGRLAATTGETWVKEMESDDSGSGSARGRYGRGGLHIVVSPHELGAGVAQVLAQRAGVRLCEAKQLMAKGGASLASLAGGERGGVVFALVTDGLLLKILREVFFLVRVSACMSLLCTCIRPQTCTRTRAPRTHTCTNTGTDIAAAADSGDDRFIGRFAGRGDAQFATAGPRRCLTHPYMHIFMNVNINMNIYTLIYPYMHTCVYIHTDVQTYMHTYGLHPSIAGIPFDHLEARRAPQCDQEDAGNDVSSTGESGGDPPPQGRGGLGSPGVRARDGFLLACVECDGCLEGCRALHVHGDRDRGVDRARPRRGVVGCLSCYPAHARGTVRSQTCARNQTCACITNAR